MPFFFPGEMPRTRGRDDFVIKHNNARRGVHTSMHGRLAIELGFIPYSGLYRIGTRSSVLDRLLLGSRVGQRSTRPWT